MLVVKILLFPRDAWLFNSPLTQAAGARHPACVCLAAWTLAPQSRVRRGTVKTCAERLPGPQSVNMFSIFSKSSKTVVADSDRAASCYNEPVTRGTCSEAVMSHVPRDVRSSVSVTKEYKRERKKSRSRQFRGLFSSDIEDEITSVVSDNPQLYHRSCSMVSAII